MSRPLAAAAGLLLAVSACSPREDAALQAGEPATAAVPASPAAPPPPSPPPATAQGQDFVAEARLLFRLAACSGDEAVPEALSAAVEAHCSALRPLMARYRERYLALARPYLAALRPAGLPRTVVYPFGGGDLLSALTTYPDATEVTTLSLEHAGDPRRVRGIDPRRLEENLARLRRGISGLLELSDSTSENLMQLQRGDLPGQLCFFLIGLAIHGQEPVSLRFFRVERDGGLRYLMESDVQALEGRAAPQLNRTWKSADFSEAFSNSELGFAARGGAGVAPRLHRHVAANLADSFLARDPSVLRHLERKGRVAAMTKAASFILWSKAFTRIRNYLLANMELMISDSTGIPPEHATKAGFVQETYGTFSGPFLEASVRHAEDFCALWESQPRRELPFRYGYGDVLRQYHLLVTRRAPPATPQP